MRAMSTTQAFQVSTSDYQCVILMYLDSILISSPKNCAGVIHPKLLITCVECVSSITILSEFLGAAPQQDVHTTFRDGEGIHTSTRFLEVSHVLDYGTAVLLEGCSRTAISDEDPGPCGPRLVHRPG